MKARVVFNNFFMELSRYCPFTLAAEALLQCWCRSWFTNVPLRAVLSEACNCCDLFV